jgi:hypothetical protein
MSLKDWYHTLNKEHLDSVPELQYINYIIPEQKAWTTLTRFRVRPFYYCSKPSAKRWKR